MTILGEQEAHALTKAMLCGLRPENMEIRGRLIQTGIIHLFVVSGLHVAFLTDALGVQKFRFGWLLLFCFCGMVGFQPPVVRAALSCVFRSLSDKWRLFWTPSQALAAALFVIFLFRPDWFLSLSLQLSWVASLAIIECNNAPTVIRTKTGMSIYKKYHHLLRALFMYLALIPLLMPLQIANPLTVLVNALIVPVSAFMFSGSAISILTPWTTQGMNFFWDQFLDVLGLLQLMMPFLGEGQEMSPFFGLFYCIGMHGFVLFRERW